MRERGFAMVSVMFLLLAAASAAGVALLTARGDLGESEAVVRQAKLTAALDGAAALVVSDLMDKDALLRAPTLDGSRTALYAVGDATVEVRVLSESGRLNVNLAPVEDIVTVTTAVAGQTSGQQLQRRIASYPQKPKVRNVVDARDLFGAEDERGFRLTAPFLTTLGFGVVDPAQAPAGMRRALPRLVADRPAAKERQPIAIEAFAPVALFMDARLAGGARLREERIVTMSRTGDLITLEHRRYDADAMEALFGGRS